MAEAWETDGGHGGGEQREVGESEEPQVRRRGGERRGEEWRGGCVGWNQRGRGGQISPKPNPCLELQSSRYGT